MRALGSWLLGSLALFSACVAGCTAVIDGEPPGDSEDGGLDISGGAGSLGGSGGDSAGVGGRSGKPPHPASGGFMGGLGGAGSVASGGTDGVGGNFDGVGGFSIGGSGNAGSGSAGSGSGGFGAGGTGGGGTGSGGFGGGGSGSGGSGSDGSGGNGAGGFGGGGTLPPEPLDCGPSALVLENAGPPRNRVNYIIAGDGYLESELGTTYVKHLEAMLKARFAGVGGPYARYRNFVNICALEVPSATSGLSGPTAFDGYGDDESRLAYVNTQKFNAAIVNYLPASIEVDWKAVVLNNDRWWAAGGIPMIWSGAHAYAPEAALHEGGHSFHTLADEYSGGGPACNGGVEPYEINVTHNPQTTAGKWSLWRDYVQTPGTGTQDVFDGGRYCNPGDGLWRPSYNSMMRDLFAAPPANYFNSISQEKIIRDLYAIVSPIDAHTSNHFTLTNPEKLEVFVIDPAVLKIDWSVDGEVVAAHAGGVAHIPALGLAAGAHTISARVYDDTPLVRGNRSSLEQTVTWQIVVE